MIKKTENNAARKHHFSFSFMFSGASILGITFTTCIVFLLMWYFSSDNTISLQNVNVFNIFILTLFLSIIITFTLRRIFITPLVKLTEAMNKVAAGNFSIRLNPDSRHTDLAEVYSSFNTMVDELSQIDTLQTDFISNVSHEFKTPINAVQGYASLLQDKTLSQEERESYVDKIIFNTRRLSELVGNVLLLSKLSNQASPPKQNNYRLDEQIRQAILALESKWDSKNIDFDIELEDIVYTGAENLLAHVWTNLIDNAVKFSDQNGKITIRLNRKDNNAVFKISNAGAYIPEKEYDRIFVKFYQCDTSRKSEGNGLGLPLAKMIVEASGGKINVKSAKDQTTEFEVILPIK